MSRHRAVKNLDLADELDDGGFDGHDDYYEDMTSEQQAQMAAAFSQVQAVLGTDSPISDRQIRDALWDSYFDVDGSIAHLLDEQHKKEVRKQKEQGEEPQLVQSRTGNDSAMEVDCQENDDARAGASGGTGRAATSTGNSTPPTDSLASLSLDGATSAPTPAAAPKNKLAAKMAANKAAKAAAVAAGAATKAAPPSMSAGTPDGSGATPAPPAASGTEEPPAPEKKLSKLQQKMLAAKAARAAGQSATPGAAATAAGAAAATRGSRETAKATDAGQRESTPAAEPDVLPMQLDGFPSAPSKLVAGGTGPDSLFALAARPSAFASALAPSVVLATVPVATRLAASAPELTAALAMRERFGPSPDDKVLEARKGTALGNVGGPLKRTSASAGAAKAQR